MITAQINKSINYYLDTALLESYILLSKGGSCKHKVVGFIPPVELPSWVYHQQLVQIS